MPNFIKQARIAAAQGGPSVIGQIFEALALRLPPCRLGMSEYFDYKLFRPTLTWAEKRAFVGWRGEPALDRGNAPHCHCFADDKVQLAELLRRAALPHPPIAALYRNSTPGLPGTPRFERPTDFAAWLRDEAVYPMFAKPVHAGFGRGAFLLIGLDRHCNKLELENSPPVDVDRWIESLPNPEGKGYLLQSALRPHPQLAGLLSGRLSGLRVMTLQVPSKDARLYRAIWKVPRRRNIVDNFESGTLGNFLGAVDLNTGRVRRVIEGYGLDLHELEQHPDSGVSFSGLTLPDWEGLIEVTLAATRLMPDFRFQHWDVALTDRGPVLLEVNLFAAGGTELSQLVDERGLLEPDLLVACGCWRANSEVRPIV